MVADGLAGAAAQGSSTQGSERLVLTLSLETSALILALLRVASRRVVGPEAGEGIRAATVEFADEVDKATRCEIRRRAVIKEEEVL